jgi:2-succinyl-5-enolpyruvyl-6-hydroxy-3-cyclohexene-1-carboxylate synthase
MNLTHVVQGNPEVMADLIRSNLEEMPHPFVQKWEVLLSQIREKVEAYEPSYSQSAVVKYFEQKRGANIVHYANSMAIRLANTYSKTPVYCNRGVNGIEGSLSTAAGFSCVTDDNVFCVIGDLSFFYDQNALWNQNLRGNLRILLMNNGKGGIFDMLPGLEQSAARDKYVAATHQTTAEGICQQNHVVYRRATNMEQMQQGVDWLLATKSEHPLLLEVVTDAAIDAQEFRNYYASLAY